ncbi:hypothetical protein DFJ74DRAFT_656368 [Hyaloraphidium curvatum]|nr:hypothetical protein DFJ74DRAFT_656368 [Hyaloraphidium curvatum]
MTRVRNIVKIRAKAGMEKELAAVVEELARQTKKNEPGALMYDVHQSQSDPLDFYFLEEFKDDAAIEFHRKSSHFRTLGKQMGSYMDGAPVMTRVTFKA